MPLCMAQPAACCLYDVTTVSTTAGGMCLRRRKGFLHCALHVCVCVCVGRCHILFRRVSAPNTSKSRLMTTGLTVHWSCSTRTITTIRYVTSNSPGLKILQILLPSERRQSAHIIMCHLPPKFFCLFIYVYRKFELVPRCLMRRTRRQSAAMPPS